MPDEQPASAPTAPDLLVALATRDERLALILGPPRPWAGTPGVLQAALALPSAPAPSPSAGRDEALALGARLLGLDLEPAPTRWTYGPSARHAMDRSPAASASAPFLRYERLEADTQATAGAAEASAERQSPRRVNVQVYLARANSIGAPGVIWLPLAALRAVVGGLWLPDLLALERVELASGTFVGQDETLIFTPAAAGERQLLRACAKYGDAALFPPR